MQQFYEDGWVCLLHKVCSTSPCTALLRAAQGVTQPGGSVHVSSSLHQGPRQGWGRPRGLSTHSSAVLSTLESFISHTSPARQCLELRSPWRAPGSSGSFQLTWELLNPRPLLQAAAASPAGGLVTRDTSVLPLVCSTQGLGCHPARSITSRTLQRFRDPCDTTPPHDGDAQSQIFILIQDYLAG